MDFERDGNNHIYHYADNGKLINQVTKGDWEVTNYYGYNPANKTLIINQTQITESVFWQKDKFLQLV